MSANIWAYIENKILRLMSLLVEWEICSVIICYLINMGLGYFLDFLKAQVTSIPDNMIDLAKSSKPQPLNQTIELSTSNELSSRINIGTASHFAIGGKKGYT